MLQTEDNEVADGSLFSSVLNLPPLTCQPMDASKAAADDDQDLTYTLPDALDLEQQLKVFLSGDESLLDGRSAAANYTTVSANDGIVSGIMPSSRRSVHVTSTTPMHQMWFKRICLQQRK